MGAIGVCGGQFSRQAKAISPTLTRDMGVLFFFSFATGLTNAPHRRHSSVCSAPPPPGEDPPPVPSSGRQVGWLDGGEQAPA